MDVLEEVTLPNGTVIRAHRKEFCTPPCPLHAPSDHHMKEWELHWRDDRAIFERICVHGIGHPDPDTLTYLQKMRGSLADSEAIHGCDGCCVQKNEADEAKELAAEYNKV